VQRTVAVARDGCGRGDTPLRPNPMHGALVGRIRRRCPNRTACCRARPHRAVPARTTCRLASHRLAVPARATCRLASRRLGVRARTTSRLPSRLLGIPARTTLPPASQGQPQHGQPVASRFPRGQSPHRPNRPPPGHPSPGSPIPAPAVSGRAVPVRWRGRERFRPQRIRRQAFRAGQYPNRAAGRLRLRRPCTTDATAVLGRADRIRSRPMPLGSDPGQVHLRPAWRRRPGWRLRPGSRTAAPLSRHQRAATSGRRTSCLEQMRAPGQRCTRVWPAWPLAVWPLLNELSANDPPRPNRSAAQRIKRLPVSSPVAKALGSLAVLGWPPGQQWPPRHQR
jgi:hypothetical protein